MQPPCTQVTERHQDRESTQLNAHDNRGSTPVRNPLPASSPVPRQPHMTDETPPPPPSLLAVLMAPTNYNGDECEQTTMNANGTEDDEHEQPPLVENTARGQTKPEDTMLMLTEPHSVEITLTSLIDLPQCQPPRCRATVHLDYYSHDFPILARLHGSVS